VTIRGRDSVPAALIKGDPRMAEVLHRRSGAISVRRTRRWSCPAVPTRWRVGGYLADEMIRELQDRGVRYEAGRAMLPHRLAHQVLLRMEAYGDSPDDRVQDAVARSKPVRAYAAALWPALDPAKLILRLLTDEVFLARAADGILSAAEQQEITMAKRPGPSGPPAGPWPM
jgi:hypothetical protein